MVQIKTGSADLEHISSQFFNQGSAVLPDVCKNAVRLSKQPSLYIVNANVQTSVGPLIQSLHKNSFATTFCTHFSHIEELIRSDHPKNIVFFISNINKILNLILASSVKSARHIVNGYKDGNITDIPPLILYRNSSVENFDKADEARSIPSLPDYCIQIHPTLELIRTDTKCNYELSITQAELQHGSILSDPVHHATRDLSNNNIWNSKNHLIFVVSNSNIKNFSSFVDRKVLKSSLGMKDMVSNGETHQKSRRGLQVLFQFIWRFFKGVKTVICLKANCFYYNPVLEQVAYYPISDAENRVDFQWDDWNGKIFLIQSFTGKGTERASVHGVWDDILADALQSLQTSKKILFLPFLKTVKDFDHYEDG
ncbi:unnamed protein product [Bemisia tabaci]|uniref:Uncharacterized protein n=1 Tax=Bemisia tabaci TaxID=7038 RepID=A0A9P0AJ79_BEMTA|nr:unnamed protein product [Bemisia tabaci]